jgi:hypothetical protein
LVAGRNRVPRPATGNTAFFTLPAVIIFSRIGIDIVVDARSNTQIPITF